MTSKHIEIRFSVETDREQDGRWIGEVPELPGVLAYGSTQRDAFAAVQALALIAIADRIQNSDALPLTAYRIHDKPPG